MSYKVGISTGLYTVARSEELSTVLRKLGFGLTRGTSVIEITGDIPHEIDISTGLELMAIANKQGLELTLHGPLTVPICIPERGEWRDADDHMKKAVRSAVFAGCTYMNVHTCLNIWLELMTYAGRKLTMVFCDHEGHFIGKILKDSEKLREWFIARRWHLYYRDMLNNEEFEKARHKAQVERGDVWIREEMDRRSTENAEKILKEMGIDPDRPTPETGRIIEKVFREERTKVEKEVREQASKEHAELQEMYIKEEIRDKLKNGRDWDTEELRGVVGVIDGYQIMAHYLFYTKDPLWGKMVEMYRDVIVDKYKMNYGDDYWLDDAWKSAEKNNDRSFKEFFYAVVGAKFLEGHIKHILDWMKDDKDGLVKEINDLAIEEEEKEKILANIKRLKLAFETPDARDPQHAGLFILWHPKQQYAAIKTIRKTLKTDKVWMLMDYEHVATQGVDAIKDMEKVVKIAPDFGEFVISVHSNPPNPLHAMDPIELGDDRVYQLLWMLRTTGFGKGDHNGYLIFERGGAKDPFAKSVEVLRLCIEYLERDIPPDELPPEFYGIKGAVAGSDKRQMQIIKDHFHEPLRDLLEMPEEEWTFLSQTAIKKGKKGEIFKKGEFR
ncbi:MAG: hypothetical protein ISS36_03480 [Candidatus Aenigmarchaeota archaeon]|nr:hypothetical protein [Candidatus Aenigmarchaeota archaeon]